MFITECPRDAMQGWPHFIPTPTKIDYINSLMDVGYDVLDCASFVSPKLIPQMADSGEVIDHIDKSRSNTKLSVIVANYSLAEKALLHPNIDFLGFPFSISETFQHKNTNKSRENAFIEVQRILSLAKDKNKDLILYFSMAFGNPYGEIWRWEEVGEWVERFDQIGIKTIMLSDTTGIADSESIRLLFSNIPAHFPKIEFGAHFHTLYRDSYLKIKTAYDYGCRRFDSTIRGIGGCPMAKDDLLGNMPTEQLINFLQLEKVEHPLNLLNFESAYNQAKNIFGFNLNH
ncbi:hydroxymethylglutaryl-CoA lyase [Elizabethkingia argentiflava]|uniref:Hydroxymethylglutaryl-CoA lyase n=1 Tax=Elizabethkingia argenteiflava TaxID=2681556 RepID=A0A845PTG2_9FLAO|nr:hydroxymethylglutaryl-CoA lyase [Elizabethkingia argenteiflava]NAW50343.1 hydroxymethylglutaryl-CoA lyase [Elizabethkingia argenteiflava]